MKIQSVLIKKLSRMSYGDLPESLVVLVSEKDVKAKGWVRTLPLLLQDRVIKSIARLKEPFKEGTCLKISGVEKKDPDVLISVLPKDRSSFRLLGFSKGVVNQAVQPQTKSIGLVFVEDKDDQTLVECLSAALSVRIFLMPAYGKMAKEQKRFHLNQVKVFASTNLDKAARYGFETGNGTNLTRYLGVIPPNKLSEAQYGTEIKRIAKENRLGLKFYSNVQLKKMGAGAFTAVDQGNPNSKGGIYELTYNPSRAKNKKPVALVGKGLCFDTGGYDIKTGGYMLGMKGDMLGSAVALATTVTAAKLKLPIKLKTYLAVTENHISPKAYKADEVVIALNGLSIEVINTDAEGRMVLADTLTLASKAKPELMVDFATLTGMAIYAIGQNYAAGFTNKDELHAKVVKAGKISGERVWTFPLDKDYGKALESKIADTLQCTKGRSADHILAAFFLNRFVGKGIPWVHIDLSPGEKEGGLAHVGTSFTGFGVRWCLEFLRQQYKF